MKVDFTHRSRQDLQAISAYIEADRPRAAASVINRLIDAGLSLDRLSTRYPVVAEPDVRRMPVGAYLIFYRITDRIEILHIFHSARDWPNLLDDPA